MLSAMGEDNIVFDNKHLLKCIIFIFRSAIQNLDIHGKSNSLIMNTRSM
jgi:hypothetical protein